EPEQGTVDWYNYHINELKRAQQEAGITIEEYNRLNREISMLQTTFNLQIEVEGSEQIANVKNEMTALNGVMQGVSQGLSDAFSTIGNGIVSSMNDAEGGMSRFQEAMMNTVAKVITMAMSSAMANAIAGGSAS